MQHDKNIIYYTKNRKIIIKLTKIHTMLKRIAEKQVTGVEIQKSFSFLEE